MPARVFSLGIGRFLLIFVSLLHGACGLRIASIADRRASFAPHKEAKVGAEPLAEFFGRRTALVVGGDGPALILPLQSKRSSSGKFAMRAFGSRFSTAAAIDSRGYFLTASHAFEKRPPFLAYYQRNGLQIAPTRVVWRGDFSKGEPDLAILRVPGRIESVFQWAADPRPGPLAFAAGIDSESSAKFRLACLAGRVMSVSHRDDSDPASMEIFHSVPLHRGDSGGPLASPEGHLMGINTEIELTPFRFAPIGIAERPDVRWIRELIDTDAKMPAVPVSERPPRGRKRTTPSDR